MNSPSAGPAGFSEFSLERWRERFLRTVLYVTSAIGLLGIAAYAFTSNTPLFTWLAIGFYLILLAFTFIPMGYYPRAGFFMTLLILLSLFTLLDTGVRNTAILFYLGTTILAALIYTPRSAAINAAFNILCISIVGWLVLTGRFVLFSGAANTGTLSEWIQAVVYYLLLVTLILSGIRLLKRDFFLAEGQANRLLDSLRVEQLHLADRVAAATRNLTLAAEVGRAVSQEHDLDTLLQQAVDLIHERFDLYYTQVYLIDPGGRWLIHRAGTGEVGRQLRQRRHTLTVDLASLNGTAAVERTPVVVEDTHLSTIHRPNPLLPETLSEMVVPLMVRDRVVGTLDMQSRQAGALNQDNLAAFQALAGQLAIAVENATLLAETEEARRIVEAQSRRLVRSGWQDFLDAIERGERIGYAYDREKLTTLTEPVTSLPEDPALVVPIEIAGEAVGLFKFENAAGWSPAEADLAAGVSRQLSQQIENLRLLAQADRYRAEAEQALARLTRQGWEEEARLHPQAESGYVYDHNAVTQAAGIQEEAAEQVIVRPLQVFGQKIGELTATGGGADSAETAELLEKVGEQLSARVENLRLFYETQRSQVEVEKRARQLAAVAAIGTVSSQELDVERMLQSVAHLAQRQFGLYHAHIYLYDEDSHELRLAACGWKEAEAGPHGQGTIPLSDLASAVARSARLRQPVVVNDLRAEPGWEADPGLTGAVSELAVPLVTGDQLQGVLAVLSDQVEAFTQEDANVQTTLASQVAISLQNARSFLQAQKQAEREALLNIIGQKIRQATSVEAVLQIAARELGHALGAPMTIARLGLKDKQPS